MAEEITLEVVQSWLDMSPFIKFTGLEAQSVDKDKGEVVIRMPMRPELARGADSLDRFHGGPVAALVDTVGAFAIAVLVKGRMPTINFRVDYLRPSTGPYLDARAIVRRVGRTIGVVDIDVIDSEGNLTSVGRGCYGTQVD
jgi:uncharacterized protein (TIGR00369 family)